MMSSPPLYVEILAFVFFIVKGRYAIKHSLTIKKPLPDEFHSDGEGIMTYTVLFVYSSIQGAASPTSF
jgi:hypothetical protein